MGWQVLPRLLKAETGALLTDRAACRMVSL